MRLLIVPLVLIALDAPAAAEPLSPGIDYQRTGGYHVVVVDLDSDSSEVRVARPHASDADDAQTVASHALEEGATVAINANFFGGALAHPCGMARGFGAQFYQAYPEAVNCETSLGWTRGDAAVFSSAGHTADPAFMPQFPDVVTGGGYLLSGGARRDWNHAKLEEGRDCSAVGVSGDRQKLILVVTDKTACTGAGLQDVLLAHGAADAIHLDGGGSTKMWIRGRGYVNDETEDRTPSVVITARPRGDCPSDCQGQCVQLKLPFRAQCVGEPCRAGLEAIWNCDADDVRRAHCDASGNVESEYCADGCMVMPIGSDDVCIGGAVPEPVDAGVDDPDAATPPAGDDDGGDDTGCCSASGEPGGFAVLALLVALLSGKRKTRRASRPDAQ